MVFVANETTGAVGIMGLYGGPQTQPNNYDEGNYYDVVWTNAMAGQLTNTTDSDLEDAGYGLQWNRATLAPGETWTIVAYEKFTGPGDLQVIAPPGQTVNYGDTVTYQFIVLNLQTTDDTFNLQTASSNGWPTALPNGNTVTIPTRTSATVEVTLATASGPSSDSLTLTATSQTFAVPEIGINVQGNGISIANGDTTPSLEDLTDFGSVSINTAKENSFTIQSLGIMDLNLTGNPLVAISGPNASDFVVTVSPNTPVAAGGTTNFSITFAPTASGLCQDHHCQQ
jgi:hypothetical protein